MCMENIKLYTLIESVLGKGKTNTNSNIAFFCPFCHHSKRKLEVNLTTQHFHCWVCNTRGRKLVTLFNKLQASRDKITRLYELLDTPQYYNNKKSNAPTQSVSLPKEFIPLWKIGTTPDYKNAVFYLKKRGIGIHDILKYRIGYCESGEYKGKIIVPSFDAVGNLNYFVGRAYYTDDTIKHKNPSISKDMIGFELFINWKLPIVICEGAFDAITIKRNAIPLFGKTISPALKQKIVTEGVHDIYVCLDQDARKQAIEFCDYFRSNGSKVYFVDLEQKDPNEIGFPSILKTIEHTSELTESQLIKYKLFM